MKKLVTTIICIVALFSCSEDGSSISTDGSSDGDGQGGSLAVFALKGDYLYAVDQRELSVFNISDTKKPVEVNSVFIGFDIETLFSYKDFLYIGSQTGMFIYDIKNPELPERLASVSHFRACDPVIANDTHAYVTLNSDAVGCGGSINQLETYKLDDIKNPVLLNTRNLKAPKGLGFYQNYLLVCDDEIKIFDITDPENSKLVTSIPENAFDLIVRDNLLIAIGDKALYQYELNPSDIEDIKKLSTISI